MEVIYMVINNICGFERWGREAWLPRIDVMVSWSNKHPMESQEGKGGTHTCMDKFEPWICCPSIYLHISLCTVVASYTWPNGLTSLPTHTHLAIKHWITIFDFFSFGTDGWVGRGTRLKWYFIKIKILLV